MCAPQNQSKPENTRDRKQPCMRVAFNFNGPNKLEKISFNNIIAMKINAIFKYNSTNNPSTDNNLDTVRFYQKCQLKQLGSQVATWRFKEGLKETDKVNIWQKWRKRDKEKEISKEKRRDVTYAERR